MKTSRGSGRSRWRGSEPPRLRRLRSRPFHRECAGRRPNVDGPFGISVENSSKYGLKLPSNRDAEQPRLGRAPDLNPREKSG